MQALDKARVLSAVERVPAVVLGALLGAGVIVSLLATTPLAVSPEERIAATMQGFWQSQAAFSTLKGRYFTQEDFQPPGSPSFLALLKLGGWKDVRFGSVGNGRAWSCVLVGEAPPHYVVLGADDLRIFELAEIPETVDFGVPAGWRLIHESVPPPFFSPMDGAVGGDDGRNNRGKR